MSKRVDIRYHRQRIASTVAGAVFVALGLWVFKTAPADGKWLALFLCSFGGVLIDQSRLLKVLRLIVRRDSDEDTI